MGVFTSISPPKLDSVKSDLATDRSSNWVPVAEAPLFKPRKLRVVCIGAGYSGLMLAYKLKYEMPMEDFIDLAIYEKNADVGGTWLENRYPGVACDVRSKPSLPRFGDTCTNRRYVRSRLTSTPSRSNQTPTGPHSTPKVPKFGTISRGRRINTLLTNVFS